MSFEIAQAKWARALIGGLADAGVRDVVLSPGSRSTPFVLQVLAEDRLEVHDVIDERGAAFFALGQARATGRPSALVATSGTAGAHYLPAAIEANLSFVPLIMITADRPGELQGCGALQTVDQMKLFGDHARAFFEVGLADADPGALRGLRRIAAQAVFASMHPLPGAVHLNVKARKPLEGMLPQRAARHDELEPRAGVAGWLSEAHDIAQGAARQGELEPRAEVGGLPRYRYGLPDSERRAPVPSITHAVRPRLLPPKEIVEAVVDLFRKRRRGLIAAGPGPLAQAGLRRAALRLAEKTRYPLCPEATSQLRFLGAGTNGRAAACDAFDALLHSPSFRAAHRPELILQLGPIPTSSGFEAYLSEHRDVERIVIAPHGWNDPDSSASMLIAAEIGETLELLADALEGKCVEPSPWPERFLEADQMAARVIERDLFEGTAEDPLSEGLVARLAVEYAPLGSLLAVANGLPIRHVDTFCPGALNDLGVLSQRGASGIDGFVSGAAGAASVAGRPLTVLVGDVGLLHDLGGLASAARAEVPLVIVVIHNEGGRIFEQLPIAQQARLGEEALAHWITPHRHSFGPICQMFGLSHEIAATRSELVRSLTEAQRREHTTVIEAKVDPHSARDQYARIWAALETELRTQRGEP